MHFDVIEWAYFCTGRLEDWYKEIINDSLGMKTSAVKTIPNEKLYVAVHNKTMVST